MLETFLFAVDNKTTLSIFKDLQTWSRLLGNWRVYCSTCVHIKKAEESFLCQLNGFRLSRQLCFCKPCKRSVASYQVITISYHVNDQLPVVHLKELSYPEVESLWLLIKPRRLPRGFNSIILAAIYHPPQSDDRALLTHLIESLDSLLTSYPASAIIIAGDFNQFRHSQLCNSFSLKQVVKQATR